MAMKRSLELGSFALAAALIFGFVACDDSSDDNGGQAYGGATAAGGVVGVGGLPETGVGGSTAGAGNPDCNTNLLAVGLGTSTNYIGGDPLLATDNPCGVQGALYAYGDSDKDASGAVIPGTAKSCTVPDPIDCTAGGCTIAGTTQVDSTYAAWGCGIGLVLNDDGTGKKSPFAGAAKGFRVTLGGTGTGQEVRVAYTYHDGSLTDAANDVAPFWGGADGKSTIKLAAAGGSTTYTIMFDDVTCPPDGWKKTGCTVSVAPFDLQFQVCGGTVAGAYTFTVSDITPVTEDVTGAS